MSVFGAPRRTGFSGIFAGRRQQFLIAPGYVAPGLLLRAQADGVVTAALGPDDATWVEYGADTARFAGSSRLLRLSGQRTNSLISPRTVGGTGWTLTNMTNVGSVADPTGRAAATIVLSDGSDNAPHRATHSNFSLTTTAIGELWSLSFLASPITPGIWVQAAAAGGGNRFSSSDVWGNFHLSGAGAVGTLGSAVTAATIVQVGPRYRITMTFPAAVAGETSTQQILLGTAANGSTGRVASFPGANRQVAFDWPQLEFGPFASLPVLPAFGGTGASTRGPDSVAPTLAALGISGRFAIYATVILDRNALNSIPTPILQADANSNSDRYVLRNQAGSAVFQAFRTTAGVSSSLLNVGSMVAGVRQRLGLAVNPDAGTFRAVLNSGAIFTDTGGPTTITNVRVATSAVFDTTFYGQIGTFIATPGEPSNAEFAARVAALP
jgi:hypothetical protein